MIRRQNTLLQILLVLLSVAVVAGALGYVLVNEEPTGRLAGKVLLPDGKTPLGDIVVELNGHGEDSKGNRLRRRTVRVRPDGTFEVRRIVVGKYSAMVGTESHNVADRDVFVSEGETADLTLRLSRTQPDLRVGTHQRVWTPREQVILPVRGYLNVGKTAQTDKMTVTVYKARLSNLLRNEETRRDLNRLGNSYDDNPSGLPTELLTATATTSAPTRLYSETIAVEAADREGFFTRRIPIKTSAGVGAYLVNVTHGARQTSSWLLNTNIGLVLKRDSSNNNALAFAADLTTGKPLGGVQLQTLRAGVLTQTGVTTNRDGLADLPSAFLAAGQEQHAVAVLGDDEAVVRQNGSGDYSGGDAVFLQTDRPIYRPGHTILYKGIARRRKSDTAEYAISANRSANVTVTDPSGETVHTSNLTTNANGSFHSKFDLSSESPTGTYTLTANVDGYSHTHDIVVASYRKPEFSATITTSKPRFLIGETAEVTVEGKYYHGAPLAGGKARWFVSREADWSAEYDDAGEYNTEEGAGEGEFGSRGWYGETVAEGEAILDENGKAIVRFAANTEPVKDENNRDEADKVKEKPEPPQSLNYTVSAVVTDDAQRETEAEARVRVTAGDVRLTVQPEGYVGVKSKATGVFVTARDWDGKLLSNQSIELRGTYAKPTPTKQNPKPTAPAPIVVRGTTGADGRAILSLTPNRRGNLHLAATTTDRANRRISTTTDLWVIGAGGVEDQSEQTDYADLSLLTDKRQYEPGDTATVLVNAARVGQTALVTVEGDKIHARYIVPIRQNSTVLKVPVLAKYGPNVTLAACYVRHKKFATSQIPLRVALPQSEINLSVTSDKPQHLPGENVTYTVQATNKTGKPVACEMSLGVVDESIYALRSDDPKAIRETFYPRRYNRVSTGHSFDVQYLDGDKAEPRIEARTKFADTAYWNPTLVTDARTGRATATFVLPDNLTTWRATAIAVSDETAVGRSASKMLVTKPFFVRLETPRFVTQSDKFRLLTVVHNQTGASQTANVRLTTEGGGLTLADGAAKTVTLAAGAVEQVVWEADARTFGTTKLRATAWIGGATNPTFTDGMEQSLPVRPFGRERLTTVSGALRGAGESKVIAVDGAAVPDLHRMTVRLTPTIGASVTNALAYLLEYPYECVEQTTSRFAPLAVALKLEQQLGNGRRLLSDQQRARAAKHIRNGLTRLVTLQHGDGAWGWWEYDTGDAFMTAYALHGMATAREAGQTVSETALARGREYAKKLALTKDDTRIPLKDRPFLLYALSVAGDTETGRAERGKYDLKTMPAHALAYLALLDQRLGGNGGQALSYLKAKAQDDGALIYWKTQRFEWNAADRMTTALALMALINGEPTNPDIPKIVRWLMQSRTEGYWENTRDTAFVLHALCRYLAANPNEAGDAGTVVVRVNGETVRTTDFSTTTARGGETVVRPKANRIRKGQNTVEVARVGGVANTGTLFYTVALRQTISTTELPVLDSSGVTVRREYLRIVPRRVGADGWKILTEPLANGDSFRQGDRIRIKLIINSTQEIGYALIEDQFAAGLEPTERGSAEVEGDWNAWYSGSDVRDDRIAFFARTLPKGKSVIEYNLRAQTPGTFNALPASAQAMYLGSLRAESGSDGKVQVKENK